MVKTPEKPTENAGDGSKIWMDDQTAEVLKKTPCMCLLMKLKSLLVFYEDISLKLKWRVESFCGGVIGMASGVYMIFWLGVWRLHNFLAWRLASNQNISLRPASREVSGHRVREKGHR